MKLQQVCQCEFHGYGNHKVEKLSNLHRDMEQEAEGDYEERLSNPSQVHES